MRRTSFGLSILFLTCLTPSVTTAQQADRRAEPALLDCGYVCVFAQSTELIESLERTAGLNSSPLPDTAHSSPPVTVTIAATDRRPITNF